MSLRIRRGSIAAEGGGGGGGGIYGPTNGAQSVRDGAGNRSQTYGATPGATTVNSSMTLAAINTAISNAGSGAHIDWSAGTYPIGEYVFYANQTWTGLGSGAVITGATTVTPTLSGGFWRITGVANLGSKYFSGGSTPNERSVRGVSPNGMSVRANQVFWDNQKLWQVTSQAALTTVNQPYGPGTFYHDTATSIIYLDPGLGNPSGHTVQISTFGGQMIMPGGTPSSQINFTLRNFTVEKAGNGPQGDSVVNLRNGGHVVDCTVRLNHGSGIHMQQGCLVEYTTLASNGQINIHGGNASCADATGVEMAYCESSEGNDAGYNWGFEGGETKWLYTRGLYVHHNWFHDSYGMSGPWTDGQNVEVLYEENVVEDGAGMGIDCEFGGAATNTPGAGHTVRFNYVSNCGHEHPIVDSSFGAGIFADQCRSVLVHNNWVENCRAGICWSQQPLGAFCGYLVSEAKNGWAHHNKVRQPTGIAAGLTTISEPNAASYFSVSPTGILYEDNVYLLDSLSSNRFKWMTAGGAINTLMTNGAWTTAGQDDGSTFEVAP